MLARSILKLAACAIALFACAGLNRSTAQAFSGCTWSAGKNCVQPCDPQHGQWGCACTAVDCVGVFSTTCEYSSCDTACCGSTCRPDQDCNSGF